MSDSQNDILDNAWKLRSNDLPFNSKKDAIIIASIIEKETPQINELKLVSGVIMNRLRSGIPLGMDSTIVYEFTDGNPKNMRSIKQSDLEKNTKYNTRKFSCSISQATKLSSRLLLLFKNLYRISTLQLFVLHPLLFLHNFLLFLILRFNRNI